MKIIDVISFRLLLKFPRKFTTLQCKWPQTDDAREVITVLLNVI